MSLKNNKAFTLIEIMVGILIVSIVLIGGFKTLVSVNIGKSKLIQETNIQKQSFYFTQKLFEMIKKGGTLDYEEYFNRKVIGTDTSSGHFSSPSGFGNFGNNGSVGSNTFGELFYYCRSNDGTQMTGTGCVSDFHSGSIDYTGKQQRFGEYSFQFRDYNSNYDSDLGDEDGDGEIIGDDDDEYLGLGPTVFGTGENIKELYLISGDKKRRTYFRWNVKPDPALGTNVNCTFDSDNNITGTGCLGTIEYLKLDGKDWGMDHNVSNTDSTQGDGVIDTWIINTEFTSGIEQVAGTGTVNWVSLFPDTINVSDFKIYAYPNIDINYNWKSNNIGQNIASYVILKIKVQPSWKSRAQVGGASKELDLSMTIALTDMYSK